MPVSKIAARAIPDRLHLLVRTSGQPVSVPGDRGSVFEYAYTVESDRPATPDTRTTAVDRSQLEREEAGGSVWFVIDPGTTHDGLMLRPPKRSKPHLIAVDAARARAHPLSGRAGLWGGIVADHAVSGSAWTVLDTTPYGPLLHLVIDEAPADRAARISHALGERPHPEIVVVDSVQSVPRVWRKAAAAALASNR